MDEVGLSGGHAWGSFWSIGEWPSMELYGLQPTEIGLICQTIPKDILPVFLG